MLYLGSVVVCCSLFLVMQLLYLVTNHCRALPYLALAGLTGGGSLWVCYKYKCWLCQNLGAWSIEVSIQKWYTNNGSWSDLALLDIYFWNV